MPRQKKAKGRPPKVKRPEPIPDNIENITQLVLKTRSKEEREMLAREAEKAATGG